MQFKSTLWYLLCHVWIRFRRYAQPLGDQPKHCILAISRPSSSAEETVPTTNDLHLSGRLRIGLPPFISLIDCPTRGLYDCEVHEPKGHLSFLHRSTQRDLQTDSQIKLIARLFNDRWINMQRGFELFLNLSGSISDHYLFTFIISSNSPAKKIDSSTEIQIFIHFLINQL